MEGQENLQEILSKQLLLCQILTALSVVRTGDRAFSFSPVSMEVLSYLFLCCCCRSHRPLHVYFVLCMFEGGHFVCKTFDLFTPFSVGLIYLLYLCFERVSLFKPVTSRPANSERCVCDGILTKSSQTFFTFSDLFLFIYSPIRFLYLSVCFIV